MSTPRVTVLMTLYNKGPFVEEAVRSVLNSKLTDIELLIVDDASTDDGPERIGRFLDPRIRLLRHDENTGRATAANRGFDAARGEYVAVLDADDLAHADRFAEQVAFLDAHPELGACGTFAAVIGAREHLARWPVTDAEARGLLLFEDPMLYGSAMFRRAVLEANQLRCRANWSWPGMDYLFLLDVAKHTRVATIPKALTTYRLGAHNFRHGRDREEDSARIQRRAFEFYGIEANETELRAHLFLLRRVGRSPNAVEIRAMFAWAKKLLEFNRTNGPFTPSVFEARVAADLAHWYYVLADSSTALALLHLRLAGGWPGSRLLYLLKKRFGQLLGR